MLVEQKKAKLRWEEYFEKLLNQENPKERKIRTEKKERDVGNISEEIIRNVSTKMKKGKLKNLTTFQ